MNQIKENKVFKIFEIAFSRIPFFELAFVTIIFTIIIKLPNIIDSLKDFIVDNQTFWLGASIIFGLFILLTLCVIGIISRNPLYFILNDTGISDKTPSESEKNSNIKNNIKNAFNG